MNEKNERFLGIIGEGRIYESVRRHVGGMHEVKPCTMESTLQQLAECRMVVYCSDTWSPRRLQEINRRCLQAEVALLPIYTQFDEGIIGPCVVPRKQGCISCAELRKLGTISTEFERELWQHSLSKEDRPAVVQTWLSSFSLETLATLACGEIAAYVQGSAQLQTDCALLYISLVSLESRRHAFLAHPACHDCQKPTRDRAELAVITLQSQPKQDAFTYRSRQPVASSEQILARYVDQRTGLVSSLIVENTNLLPIASSHLAAEAKSTAGTGSTLRPAQSKLVSVLEVIERYAGLRPRGKHTTVRASYNQLIQQNELALDPTTLGLHDPERYEQQRHAHTGRRMVAYHPDLVCHWVWGYSFQSQAPMLVPEHCAYYGLPSSAENPAFVYEISNGCALGNSLEEAIFHGMLEVIERDAFLLMWYAQLQVPRLQPSSILDPVVRLLSEHLTYHSGSTIQIFNITLDHAIPCLCLLGIDEQGRQGTPKALVAAGSHPHPEQALLKALREFAMFQAFPRRLDQESRADALKMLADATLVEKMEHHPLIYYLPEAFERLHFLTQTPRQQTFQEAFCSFYQNSPEHLDLREDLEELIDIYLKRNTDVIVVDQTAPEHQVCGLRCVKVLMPGLLPMTFGQHNRRITGFERLHQVPFALGYRERPLAEAEINPHPHPFF